MPFDNEYFYNKIFTAQVVAAGTTEISPIIQPAKMTMNGNFSLQFEVTGTGTCKFYVEQSNNFGQRLETAQWVKSSSGYEIVSGVTSASGIDTDGKDLLDIPAVFSHSFRIVCEETGGANPVTVTAWLAMQ